MIQTLKLLPGATLRCFRDDRFKQGCLCFQFVRRMDPAEVHFNALLPAVMLRATVPHPDLRAINQHLDSLYGVSLGVVVRRVGDYQTVGFHFSFMDDRFALPGESVLAGVVDFLEEVLTQSPLVDGGFLPELVESEKRNLISAIESEMNNKGNYAMNQLLRGMCQGDTYGLPRLGYIENVASIEPKELYEHYRRLLRDSQLEMFYVGRADIRDIADLLLPMLEKWERDPQMLPKQGGFYSQGQIHSVEQMDVTQGKLCLGFVTPVTNSSELFPAAQVLNAIFGAGMTSKLFTQVREKQSLCYSIGSNYIGAKGILTVSAGIDFDKEDQVRREILNQLEECRLGHITQAELQAAKASIRSILNTIHDSPSAIESYYSTRSLSAMTMTLEEYRQAVENMTLDQVIQTAKTVQYHSSYFLKGVEA